MNTRTPQEILESIKTLRATDNGILSQEWIHTQVTKEFAELLVVVAEEHMEASARMAKPHCLLWWTFAVAFLTFVVCVIGYWDQIVRLLQALRLWH